MTSRRQDKYLRNNKKKQNSVTFVVSFFIMDTNLCRSFTRISNVLTVSQHILMPPFHPNDLRFTSLPFGREKSDSSRTSKLFFTFLLPSNIFQTWQVDVQRNVSNETANINAKTRSWRKICNLSKYEVVNKLIIEVLKQRAVRIYKQMEWKGSRWWSFDQYGIDGLMDRSELVVHLIRRALVDHGWALNVSGIT